MPLAGVFEELRRPNSEYSTLYKLVSWGFLSVINLMSPIFNSAVS